MARTKAERRHKDWAAARRKQKICREIYQSEWYDNLHEYSKNKIHCSCPLCATKTNGRKIRGKYISRYNPSIKDLKQLEKLNYSLKEER